MQILFIYEESGLSGILVRRLKQHIKVANENVIEYIDISSVDVNELLTTLKEKNELPQYIYYCDKSDMDELNFKLYPECTVKMYQGNEYADTYINLKLALESLAEYKTVYLVPYLDGCWFGEMGGVREYKLSFYNIPTFPHFETRQEAEKYATNILQNDKEDLMNQIKEIDKILNRKQNDSEKKEDIAV